MMSSCRLTMPLLPTVGCNTSYSVCHCVISHVVRLLKHRSAVTGFVESKLLWCSPQRCWYKEIAQRTAQTQINTCRHPHSCGMKLSMTIHKHADRQWDREEKRRGNERKCRREREREGLSSVCSAVFPCKPFYIIPPIVINKVLGQHIGMVNYPI